MRLWIFMTVVVLGSSVATFSQTQSAKALKTIILSSPFAEDGHGNLKHSEKANNNCFSFVIESEVKCRERWDIIYGNMRAGDEWDWFMVSSSKNVMSKLVSMGKMNWDEVDDIPVVEPFPKLAPGETRNLCVDTSGADGVPGRDGAPGAPGAPGMNADGTFSETLPEADSDQTEVLPKKRPKKPVTTSPDLVRAVVGNMYVLRVFDDVNDFYVVIRVDEIVRGRTAKISWMRVEALQKKWQQL